MEDQGGEDKPTGGSPVVDKYNTEAAEILANKAQHLPISEAAPIYEQLLATFPTAAKYWKQYVETYMAVGNDEATKQIFSRCLLNCLQISLWRCYIRFIRKVNEKKGIEGQEETRKAFDFMLNYVGEDIASGPVWMEYIKFLKSLPAASTQEESHRMTAVRKAFQKAIVTPTHHIEQLWRDYESFENSVSRALAKGLLSEYQPKYNSARAVYRERKKYVDEIDWNMLAVPPTGSYKEELQCIAWKRLLAFEKGNPQKVDSLSSNKRIVYAYEQCLMHLNLYPEIWYDYASWHAKSGSIDAAVKVFQRALKALPDSEMLKYAYAELEESHGAIQPAKKIYENLLGDGVNATALAHIQFIRFLRRTEGVEAARKYFLDVRKSPNCTYHVYVAYAMMAFCLDKEPQIAHNVFEAGMKKFMHEPGYILEYADFLSRLNDDKNIRALFERALTSLQPDESLEVWRRFVLFEQTYGDLASMLKVEQRRKEALLKTNEDDDLALESSLQDVLSRYCFMDLWPCSSEYLNHMAKEEWLAKRIEKFGVPNGAALADKSSSGLLASSTSTAKFICPDVSQMVVYDPSQKFATECLPTTKALEVPLISSTLPASSIPAVEGGARHASDEVRKATPPALAMFIANLPAVDGPLPDVDFVLSILLQSNIPTGKTGRSGSSTQLPLAPVPAASDLSGSTRSYPMLTTGSKPTRDRHASKRKDLERQDDDETTIQSAPLPRDAFKIRQIQKGRGGTSSQTGSASCGSAFSGDLSGSTG